MTRRKLLSATTALLAVLASSPAYAAMETRDSAHIAVASANAAKQVAQLLVQIQELRKLFDLSTIANAVLGPGVSETWGALFTELSVLHNEIMNTAALTYTIPATVRGQIAMFSPPPAGSGIGGYLGKIRMIQAMLSQHSTDTLALQSKLMRANAEQAKTIAKGSDQILKAKGQMQVSQLSGIMLGNIATQLIGMQTTLSDLDSRGALQEKRAEMEREKRKERLINEVRKIEAMQDRGPLRASLNPVYLGR